MESQPGFILVRNILLIIPLIGVVLACVKMLVCLKRSEVWANFFGMDGDIKSVIRDIQEKEGEKYTLLDDFTVKEMAFDRILEKQKMFVIFMIVLLVVIGIALFLYATSPLAQLVQSL